MVPIRYVIFALGLLLEVLILWRGIRARLWRHYPFFYVYLGFVFVRSVPLFVLGELQFSAYPITYWLSNAVSDLLRFFVVWEVFRQAFVSSPVVRRVVGQVLMILLTGLTAVLFVGSKNPGLFFADLERKTGLAQAALLAATVLLARYYSLSLGRNIWGLALGFGVYLSVSIMNFSMLELTKSFFPYWRFIRPLSFIGMLGVWTWALWSYAPNPRPATAALELSERSLVHWGRAWSEVRAAVRKAVGL